MNDDNAYAAMQFLKTETWAILPSALDRLALMIEAHMEGFGLSEIESQRIQSQRSRYDRLSGKVAVIPLLGVISQRSSFFSMMFGGTSTTDFAAAFDAALNSSSFESIPIEVDSPGGSVSGIEELSTKIRNARGRKKITAHVNSGAFSAAYWIASAADELVVTPSGQVGSVGTVLMHVDQSQFNEKNGFNPTLIHSGRHKVEGHPHAPLEDDARAELQRRVDSFNDSFVEGLSDNRGVSTSSVRAKFGEGRVFRAKEAIERGMADKVEPFEKTLRRMMAGVGTGRRNRSGGVRGQRSMATNRRFLDLQKQRLDGF